MTRALAFVVTLMLAVAACEALAERRIASHDEDLVGVEIYDALRRAAAPGPEVERVYVGDSVARQFFPPGSEPNPRLRFLTTNATISLAGDFFLLEEAFRHAPNARDIVLVTRPETLRLDLDQPSSQNYFSTFFHRPAEIREMWAVTRDRRLAVAQSVHWLLPGLMAVNNLWRQDPPAFVRRGPTRARDIITVPTPVTLSPVGAHFLSRMAALAASRGGRLRVVAVPLPDSEPWVDAGHLLNAPIMYLPRAVFGDGVHVGPVGMLPCTGTEVARTFAAAGGLLADLPAGTLAPGKGCQ